MPTERKPNIFSHQTIAKSSESQSNDRFARMTEMLRTEPQEQQQEVEQPENTMAPGDLEQLIFLGRIEDSKVINGFKFDVHTLTGKEQNDVWMSVSFLNNDTKFFLIKVAFLARAVTAVNGRDLEVLYSGRDYRDLTKEQRCIRVIESWQQSVVDELYDFYSELVDRSRKAIHPDAVKK